MRVPIAGHTWGCGPPNGLGMIRMPRVPKLESSETSKRRPTSAAGDAPTARLQRVRSTVHPDRSSPCALTMPRLHIFRKSRVEPPPPSARDPQRTGMRLGFDARVAGRCPDSGGACRPWAAPAPKFSINPGVYRRRSLVVDPCFAPAPLTGRYGQNFAPARKYQ